LKRDLRHSIKSEGDSVVAAFKKPAGVRNEPPVTAVFSEYRPRQPQRFQFGLNQTTPQPPATGDTYNAAYVPAYGPAARATQIDSVYATKLQDSLKIFIGADGAISEFESFTTQSPPRIIFDIYGVRSPYEREKRIPVNTRWVKEIRYAGHPGKLRLVLETTPAYLSAYSTNPVDNGLLIHVGTRETYPGHTAGRPPARPYTYETQPEPRRKTVRRQGGPPATHVHSVYATELAGGTMITVAGNGPIEDYRVSTKQHPPGIIFEIDGVTPPAEIDSPIRVGTRYVRRIYQHPRPGGLRLEVETEPQYLSAFTANSDPDGLVIRVGQTTAGPATGAPPAVADYREPISPPPSYHRPAPGKPAIVNKVDFVSETAGRSTLIIGTTQPVSYDIQKTSDKNLELVLFNTKIPANRRRPLITTRFPSAVDRIDPGASTSPTKTRVEIDLREAVPYFIEQTDDLLMVHFEASAVPPEPLVTAQPDTTAPPSFSDMPPPADAAPVSPAPPGAFDTAPPAAGEGPRRTEMEEDETGAPPELDLTLGDSVEDLLADTPDKEYTGEKIALDFYETDIKNVFRILREVSGKNFAIEKDVVGKVTLTLGKPVPWDQVLDLILKMNDLGMTLEGDIIRIATQEKLKAEEEMRKMQRQEQLEAMKAEKELEPLKTEYIPVSYSNAETEIKPHLEQILSKDKDGNVRGTVSVDTRTNMVILNDVQEVIDKAKEIIAKIDRVTPQVLIEAKVVEATSNFSKEIGITWSHQAGITNNSTSAGLGPQRGYDTLGGTYAETMAVNLPLVTPAGSLGFQFMRIAGTPFILDAQLQAMESKGEARIVSSPKVVTLDNKVAMIKQGIEYPIHQIEDGQVTTVFKDVDLLLEVTPHVTPDNRISLSINITKNDLGQLINQEQSFITKEANTELLVNDGDTVVIGGIIKTTERKSTSYVPLLSKIPVLGWLFRNTSRDEDKEELLIFLTPRIIQLEQRQVAY
jgi:type IV pilus assembly protein PilQ